MQGMDNTIVLRQNRGEVVGREFDLTRPKRCPAAEYKR